MATNRIKGYHREGYKALAARDRSARPRKCRECGNPLPKGKRMDASYCSRACLQRARRKADPKRTRKQSRAYHQEHQEERRRYRQAAAKRRRNISLTD